jgi:hypothetical protein
MSLRLCCATISTLALMVGAMAPAVGQTSVQTLATTQSPISFDIPVQPLTRALDAYTAATGLHVLYDSDLASGRRSTAVSGVLMPDVALRVLLDGTGLAAYYAEKTFAIVPAPSNQQGSAAVLRQSGESSFFANLQGAIERAFCEKAETKPGQYRAALQFRIGTSGEVLSPELLSSTGDPQRDRTIIDLLGRLRIQQPPPPGLAQPIRMIVSPRPQVQSGDCGLGQDPPAVQATR